jgi:hypothetical protein
MIFTPFTRSSLAAFVLCASFSACASANGNAPEIAGNGVNDVKKACEITSTWTQERATECINCVVSVVRESCNCSSFKAYAGKCLAQQKDVQALCDEALLSCARDCKKDCACAEACYATAPECKQAAAARDGCKESVCTSVCK